MNIKDKQMKDFEVCSDCDTVDVPYDCNSLMHYGTHIFSKNGEPSINSKNNGTCTLSYQGASHDGRGATELDWQLVNILAKHVCPVTTPAPTNTPPTTPAPTTTPSAITIHSTVSAPTTIPSTTPVSIILSSPISAPITSPSTTPAPINILSPTTAPTPTSTPTPTPTSGHIPVPIREQKIGPRSTTTTICVKEDNVDYDGNTIGKEIVGGENECANWCGVHLDCQFWTIRKVDNMCWLKTSDSGRRVNKDYISGSRSCSILCVIEVNTTYIGNDFAYKITHGADECTNLCAANFYCKFWTLRKSDNMCWIKTSDSGRKIKEDYISGSQHCSIGCIKKENVGLTDHTINATITSGEKECSNWCGNVSSCNFWTLRKYDNMCWLTTSKLGGKISQGHISGNKDCSDFMMEGCFKEKYIEYVGDSINQKITGGEGECSNWCGKISKCKFWTLRMEDNMCWIKGAKSIKRGSLDYMSGSKQCAKDINEAKDVKSTEKFWRNDLRCGKKFPTYNGQPGQCDPIGQTPCCSQFGWCGRHAIQCNCASCINYAGYFYIKNKLSGLVLTIKKNIKDKGATLHLWQKIGSPAQKWKWEPYWDSSFLANKLSSPSSGNEHNGLVLDVDTSLGIQRGNSLRMWPKYESPAPNQKWRWDGEHLVALNLHLDSPYNDIRKGVVPFMWTTTDTETQKWILET